MDLPGDDRAAVIQVGAVLIFGILVITLAIYQSQVVPNQNREVEFDHHQTVEGRMVDLRNALLTSAVANAGRPAAVPLGTQYPTRLLAINPPQPAGRLATEPLGNISLANARATNTEADDYLNGTTLNFSTSALVYTPDYNELGSPPSFVYENTLLYSNDTGGEGFIQGLTGQELLEGSTITLVALDGDLDEAGARSVTVDPEVLSGGYRTVQVRNQSAGPVNITIPTRVPAEEWETRLNESGGNSRIKNVSDTGTDQVRISLRNGTYTLRMAKLGVGSGAVDPEPRYIVPVGSSRTSIAEGTTTELTFEVRDEYNSPVTDASVNVTANSSIQGLLRGPDGTPVNQTLQTDEDGRIVLSYEAPDIDGSALNLTVGANITGTPKVAGDREFAGVSVTVRNSDGSGTGAGGGGNNVNPVEGDVIAYQGVPDSNQSSITIQLENLDTNNNGTIERAKFSFYNADSPGNSPGNNNPNAQPPAELEFGSTGVRLVRNGQYQAVNLNFTAGELKTEILSFYEGDGTDYTRVSGGDYLVLSVIYDDGSTANYFISPSSGTTTNAISSAAVTDIVPNVGTQRQLLRVTLGTDLAETETIDFDLGEAQGTTQVDYGSGSAQAVSGGSASFTTDAVVRFDPSGELTAGDTIEVLVTGISVGSLSDNQDSSYLVSVSRSDEGGTATTTAFEVARGNGDSNLQSASASDLQSGSTGQTQTISFRPDEPLGPNERVFIDLSDAEGGTVDYAGSAMVTAGPGSVENKSRDGGTATVVYEAPSGGVSSGTEVEVSLSDVSTSGTGSYTVGFSRERGDTEGASFSVTGGESTNSPPSVTITDISTTDSGMGSSGNLDTATVTFEATDPDQNLENATVVLYIDDEERGRKTEINLTDREGDSVTEEIQPTSGGGNTKGEVEIKVIVYDDAGDTGDTRRSEEDF